ncbi:MAG TPA: WxL domain-containing protein [Trebonia sp.]|nr:WxL domain-containing protein [Trebonia sp.]
MTFFNPIYKRRSASLAATCALVLGGFASAAIAGPTAADAATCTATVGTPCVITGTATLGAGVLSAIVPGSLTWATTLNGLGQQIVDTTAADQGYTVDDATGSSAGWHVTVSATTFTNGSATLPDTGSFSTTGSVTSATATTAPSQACTSAGDCTLPDNTATTYPVAITTAATTPTPVTVYNAAAASGIGSTDIGGSTSTNPVGWWIHVPGTTTPGTYTSTITINVISGPT